MSIQQALPRRVVVSEVVSSRYSPGKRPVSWDKRKEGLEVMRSSTGEELHLFSSGQQSTPAPGWELLLTNKRADNSIEWTLYGISAPELKS